MAIYPCNVGKHRYPQPQQSAYCTTLEGRTPLTSRARLCPLHFRVVQVVAMQRLALVDDDSQSSTLCDVCGGDRETTMFLRLFPSKSDELTYAADLCAAHAEAVGAELLIANWDPLAARSQGLNQL